MRLCLRLADLAEREGRAVVIAVNKWDVETEKQDKLKELKEEFARLLPQLKGAPLVTVSAKTGKGLTNLLDFLFLILYNVNHTIQNEVIS